MRDTYLFIITYTNFSSLGCKEISKADLIHRPFFALHFKCTANYLEACSKVQDSQGQIGQSKTVDARTPKYGPFHKLTDGLTYLKVNPPQKKQRALGHLLMQKTGLSG